MFPHRVSQCALLARVASVRPQEFVKLTLTPLILGGTTYVLIFLMLTLRLLHVFELDM